MRWHFGLCGRQRNRIKFRIIFCELKFWFFFATDRSPDRSFQKSTWRHCWNLVSSNCLRKLKYLCHSTCDDLLFDLFLVVIHFVCICWQDVAGRKWKLTWKCRRIKRTSFSPWRVYLFLVQILMTLLHKAIYFHCSHDYSLSVDKNKVSFHIKFIYIFLLSLEWSRMKVSTEKEFQWQFFPFFSPKNFNGFPRFNDKSTAPLQTLN